MTTTRGGTLLGVVFLLVGLAVIGFAIASHPIPTIPLLAGIFVALLGALMITPTRVEEGAKALVAIVGPYIPVQLGRRSTDPVVLKPVAKDSPGGADADK